MKHDVFISYSRADSAIADRICEAFDKAGISYFIDRQGIGGGFEFPVVLAEAIVESKVVLFLASKSSYESKFTNAELTFAFNEKPKNSILPYIIDGSTMPPALRFVFSSINWRTIESHPIEPTLVDDILKMLGRDEESVLRAKAEEERKAKKKAAEKAEEQEIKEQTRFWNEEIQREEKEKRLRYEQRQARIEKIKNIASIIVIVIVFSIGAVGIFVEAKRWWTERQEQQQPSTEQTTTDSLKIAQEQTETQRPANKQTTNQATPEKAKQEAEAQRLADEKAAADQAAKAKSEADRKAKEKAEAERKAAEKAAAEQAAKEIAEQEQNIEVKIQKAIAENNTEIDIDKFKNAFDQATQAAEKSYKVGDYYNNGTKEGVVFYVDATGKHGKIVSLAQKYLQWCTKAQDDKGIVVGTTSKTDGKANTDKVMTRADSREYTAFVWCRNMGKSWYLPAIEELKLLLLNDSVHDAVNKTLESRGATKLYNKGGLKGYWSSTEYADYKPKFCAWFVDMYDGLTYNGYKNFSFYVRAVSAF